MATRCRCATPPHSNVSACATHAESLREG
ncbi:hypothetical protein CRE_16584 [Caenorhabditis remanei]|uniref:Uncharacterized protein n=1 Tax=Caenorhabditis remanei TaxID=31234 RepID=E3NUT7_CAERE|nr:hypothetical protein CRE_16584 [Caenorhabditis remanei]